MITTDIDSAANALRANQLVAIPTETVYGLAGNAFSDAAVRQIFLLKKRPAYNPLIVHIKSTDDLSLVAQHIPDMAYQLAARFWPGPLTLILEKKPHISDLITAGKKTVAVRIPRHPLTLDLLHRLDFPLAAPSANPFGSISPTSAHHVAAYFKDNLEVILDGGNCEQGVESTIIGFENNQVVLYRHGAVATDEIAAIAGPLKVHTSDNMAPVSPGMLSRHYSPQTTTVLTDDIGNCVKDFYGKKIGVLVFSQTLTDEKIAHQEVLSAGGQLAEAARNLYASLHRLDRLQLDVIVAERLPEVSLGLTINDRLERAAKQ